jgi:hypothetical protein
MTYHGTIKQGVVVLDNTPVLKDGTRVEVQFIEVAPEVTTSFHPVGAWEGPPGELDRLLAEVQAIRDTDINAIGNAAGAEAGE